MTDNNKDQEDVNRNGNGEIDTQDGNTAATASSSSGKKNKKGKAKKSEDQAVTPSQANLTPEQQGNLKKAMEYLSLQAAGPAKSEEEAAKKSYQFWSTQPVPDIDEHVTSNECITPDLAVAEVRQEEYTLPQGFQWDTLHLDDPLVLKELYVLLNENYVEDDDNMFRFDYSPEFLAWALKPPGYLKEWHTGVRVTKSNKLVGFISGVPAHIRMYEKKKNLVEINFLCVHKKLRAKRLAPVLIREITRRVNLTGIFQAVYTAGVVLPKPVGTCRYWHRSINPKKLIEVKFSHLSRNMTMQRHLKLYKLPDSTKTPGIREFKTQDVEAVTSLLNGYLDNFDLAPIFTAADVLHWFIPQKGIIESYVVEDPFSPGKLTDFISFYTLPSTVMNHPQHDSIKAAYSFYNVSTATSWTDLMGDALVLARKEGFDVFNALDLMENSEFLEKLKFGIGDGNLQYYLYNWKCPRMDPKKIGLVLQ